jgi:hypothetical protein
MQEILFQTQQAAGMENPQSDKDAITKSVTFSAGSEKVSEPEQGKVPKGEKCTNHPWRDAYAQCSYCKRYFCYPDLVRYEGRSTALKILARHRLKEIHSR